MNNPVPISVNLTGDLEEILIRKIDQMGLEPHKGKNNHPKDAKSLLPIYLNAMKRIIQPKPRKTHFSKEFREQMGKLSPEHQKTIEDIKDKAEWGDGLKSYLSRTIDEDFNDLMFNDWNIQHLHLETLGSQKRSNEVLFVWVEDSDIYFIKVYTHEIFSKLKQEPIEIVVQNWPELLARFELIGIKPDKLTDEQRNNVRRAHGTACIDLGNGKAAMSPGGGLMTGGGNFEVMFASVKLLSTIEVIEKDIRDNPTKYIQHIESKLGKKIKLLRAKLVEAKQGFRVIEPSTGVEF
jgi:hypothetical protein